MVYQRKTHTPPSMIGRFLLLVDAFAASGPTLNLSEISRITELPLSTTYRLLTQLTESGALVRGADRRYRIGPRLTALAGNVGGRDEPLAATA